MPPLRACPRRCAADRWPLLNAACLQPGPFLVSMGAPPHPPHLPCHPLCPQVNKKVMQMFEKAEQEYNELKRKKDVVEADKSRIQQVRWGSVRTPAGRQSAQACWLDEAC